MAVGAYRMGRTLPGDEANGVRSRGRTESDQYPGRRMLHRALARKASERVFITGGGTWTPSMADSDQ